MLQTGQVFNNRYKIISVLGEGGFGAVYKVWDDNLQRHCAIKENLQVSPEAQKQFKREAIMLANLNHPHLVRVTDYFIIPKQGQYLVMDYVEGNNLEMLLEDRGKPFLVEQALTWINQICDALIYIHNQNPPIIHRDIKPANIRVTPQGIAVLVDFGLAKTFDVGMQTSMGARGLTPHFAAPEQYGMGGTDAQSDIYSLGVTLYCLLTYSVPPDSVEIMVGNVENPPPAKIINKNIPNEISNALESAMQIRRTERYKSVGDFRNALYKENKGFAQTQLDPLVKNVQYYLDLGRSLTLQNRLQEAEEVYRKAINVDPNNAETLTLLGAFLVIQNRLAEAEDFCLKAIQVNPKFEGSYPVLGEIFLKQNRYIEAEKAFCRAIQINPNDADVFNNLGVIFKKQNRLKEAKEAFQNAIKVDSNNTNAYHNLGMLLEMQNCLQEAEDSYQKAIQTNPNSAVTYYHLGELLFRRNHVKESEDFYRKAIMINPDYVNAYIDFGVLLQTQNRMEEAEEVYRKAIQLDPISAVSYDNLGTLFHNQNRLKEAEESYRMAIDLDPTFVGAYNHISILLHDQNRVKEADEFFHKAEEIKNRKYLPSF